MSGKQQSMSGFLPNFCSGESILASVLIAQMLTIVLVMTRQGSFDVLLRDFAVLSLFILWIALSDVAVLCMLNRASGVLKAEAIGVIAFFLLQLVTLFYTSVVHWLGLTFFTMSPWPQNWLWENGIRNLSISAIVSFIALRYFYIQHQRLLIVQAEARTRINALQARIRPHFLFNSMNIIASLTRIDPQRAERTVEDLADLFRASLNTHRENHTLEDELQLIRSYLRIEQQRLGERLKVVWQVPEPLPPLLLPPLLIQPLVENTLHHGIEKIPNGGIVRIEVGACGDDYYCINIHNPVCAQTPHKGNRMAHENILQRLAIAFDNKASLKTYTLGGEYHVTLYLPVADK